MQKSIMLGGRRISYELQRKRVKNINLRIRPDGSVYVSAPRFVPQLMIDAFIAANAVKIIRASERAENAAVNKTKSFADGERVYYLGKSYVLRVVPGSRGGAEINGGELLLTVKDPENEDSRKRTLEKWLRTQCADKIGEICRRMYPNFAAYNIPWPELKYRKMKACWGNCRPKEKIVTFNTALIATDEECIEYVAAHEFTHFLHPDHSRSFYAQLALFVPDWRRRRERLKSYGALV